MGKLKLIELIGEDLESKIDLLGFQNFYNDFLEEEKSTIQYYSFNPPIDFLIRMGANKKISAEDVYSSKIFLSYLEKSRTFMQWKFPGIASGKKDFLKKENILMDTYLREIDNSKEKNEKSKTLKAISSLKKVPFFSESWDQYFRLKSYFLMSKFEIKYFPDLKEEVETCKKIFTNKEFHWKEYNQYIFEKVYKLFSLKFPFKI